jgi:hypothetical protein
MQSFVAVFFAFTVFLFGWAFNALLVTGLAAGAVYAGAGAGIFLIINMLFVWIICPGIGAFVGVSASIGRYRTVDVTTIFVGFVSVCAVLIILLFSLSVSLYFMHLNGFWSVVLFVLQSASVIFGARIGKSYALSKRSPQDFSRFI